MAEQIIIAIGREFGSGGHEIAEKLSELYGIKLYDKNILQNIAEAKNVDVANYEKYDEVPKKIWATLIAQGISAVLSFLVLLRELKRFPSGKTGIFSHTELLQMTRIALPSILQQSTVSIGMMLVQSVINSFGSEALAGFSAAMRVDRKSVV